MELSLGPQHSTTVTQQKSEKSSLCQVKGSKTTILKQHKQAKLRQRDW